MKEINKDATKVGGCASAEHDRGRNEHETDYLYGTQLQFRRVYA